MYEPIESPASLATGQLSGLALEQAAATQHAVPDWEGAVARLRSLLESLTHDPLVYLPHGSWKGLVTAPRPERDTGLPPSRQTTHRRDRSIDSLKVGRSAPSVGRRWATQCEVRTPQKQ